MLLSGQDVDKRLCMAMIEFHGKRNKTILVPIASDLMFQTVTFFLVRICG